MGNIFVNGRQPQGAMIDGKNLFEKGWQDFGVSTSTLSGVASGYRLDIARVLYKETEEGVRINGGVSFKNSGNLRTGRFNFAPCPANLSGVYKRVLSNGGALTEFPCFLLTSNSQGKIIWGISTAGIDSNGFYVESGMSPVSDSVWFCFMDLLIPRI